MLNKNEKIILTASLDGVSTGDLTELLVHIVSSRARIITKPDTKVLNLQGLLLQNLRDGNNFTGGLLNLLKLAEEVPVARLGNNFVGGKDAHLVELRSGLLSGGELTSNKLIFAHHLCLCILDGWNKGSGIYEYLSKVSP